MSELTPGAGVDQPRFVGEDHRLDAVPQPELDQYVGDVGFDGARREVQLLGDLGVRQAACNQQQDLAFALGELLVGGRELGPLG